MKKTSYSFVSQSRPGKKVSIKASLGFTLIELMVGISLGVLVLGGIIAVYIPTIQSWSTTASMAQIHDTESLVNDIFGTSIRQAGLLGCGYNIRIIDGIDPNITRSTHKINKWALQDLTAGITNNDFLRTSFRGFAADKDTQVTATISNKIQNNRLSQDSSSSDKVGDVFFTLSPSEGFYRINGSAIGAGAKRIDLVSSRVANIEIEEGSFYLVNDCANPVMVRADSTTSNGQLNYTNQQLNAYQHPDKVVVNKFEPAIFFLGSYTMPDGTLMPTLYKSTIKKDVSTGFKMENSPILTGVENMRIEYGVAMDSTYQKKDYIVNYYTINQMPASATLNDVYAVRMSIMIQAPNGGNRKQLLFPDLDGNMVDCFAGGTPDSDACPDFVISAAGRQLEHKVIQYSFILPRIISI